MAEGHWITVNGAHIFIKDGQTPAEAFKATTGKSLTSSKVTSEQVKRVEKKLDEQLKKMPDYKSDIVKAVKDMDYNTNPLADIERKGLSLDQLSDVYKNWKNKKLRKSASDIVKDAKSSKNKPNKENADKLLREGIKVYNAKYFPSTLTV